ncbi:MAG: hypothetical protein CL940_09945 [Deltaproteobacteria bacterium]|nr:hypothetical protein [Deltaproteobacteria bacterium]
MDLSPYDRILSGYQPYLVARPPVLEAINRSPLGIDIPSEHLFDPQHTGGREFVNLVKKLDALTFGPMGLEMPDWVFYDCAVMPGAVFGFACDAATVDPWVKRVLDVPAGYTGLVPVSIFIAIPIAHRQSTLVYTLCSVNQAAPGSAPEGLWRLTLAAGTAALGRDEIVATVQWRSPRLGLFSGLGPLEILTAWTPAHDNPTTCTLRCTVNDAARKRLLRADIRDVSDVQRYLDADDQEAMRELQSEIEGGLYVAIAGPAEVRGSETRIPLHVQDEETIQDGQAQRFTRQFHG